MSMLWLGFALLLLLALGFILLPMFVTLRGGELKRKQSNVNIYKDQLAELLADKEAGRISDTDYLAMTQEVKHNLLNDTKNTDVTAQTNEQAGNHKARFVLPMLALFVLIGSIYVYDSIGAQNKVAITELLKASNGKNFQPEDAQELVERLTLQSKETPDDVDNWYLLGRLQFDLGNFDQAVLGFTGVIEHLPIEAEADKSVALAQLGQSMFFANKRKLNNATESILVASLKINPQERIALGLLGVANYERKNYLKAVEYWQKLMDQMTPNNPNAMAIKGGIDKAKSQMNEAQKAQLLAQIKEREKNKASIVVTVDLADNIRNAVPKNADLFILAKAKSGPPMPLAVKRLSNNEWPVTVTLDDSMAMMPSLKLSNFKDVVITARISTNGVANRKKGDIEGSSDALVSLNTKSQVVINRIVK